VGGATASPAPGRVWGGRGYSPYQGTQVKSAISTLSSMLAFVPPAQFSEFYKLDNKADDSPGPRLCPEFGAQKEATFMA